jgi:hypothetical protein
MLFDSCGNWCRSAQTGVTLLFLGYAPVKVVWTSTVPTRLNGVIRVSVPCTRISPDIVRLRGGIGGTCSVNCWRVESVRGALSCACVRVLCQHRSCACCVVLYCCKKRSRLYYFFGADPDMKFPAFMAFDSLQRLEGRAAGLSWAL